MTAPTMETTDRQVRHRQMQRVTWVSTAVDLLLSVIKLGVGFAVRSPALIADGIHSLSDLLTDGFVLLINRVAHAEPDHDHPYGHARFENVGTLLLGTVLTAVAAGLVWDNASRILTGTAAAQPSLMAIVAVVFSLVAKEGLFHYGRYWARQLSSELLHANAWHSRSDSLSSLVVLLGVVATWFGYGQVESWAALVVAALIGRMGGTLVWNAVQKLADRGVPPDTRKALRDCVLQVPGVVGAHALRTRVSGNQVFVDLHLEVDPFISISEGHQVSNWVARRLRQAFPELGDVMLHIDPDHDAQVPGSELAPLRPGVEAALAIYPALASATSMQIHYVGEQVVLELYYDDEPGEACFDQRRQALGELPWLNAIDLYRRCGVGAESR